MGDQQQHRIQGGIEFGSLNLSAQKCNCPSAAKCTRQVYQGVYNNSTWRTREPHQELLSSLLGAHKESYQDIFSSHNSAISTHLDLTPTWCRSTPYLVPTRALPQRRFCKHQHMTSSWTTCVDDLPPQSIVTFHQEIVTSTLFQLLSLEVEFIAIQTIVPIIGGIHTGLIIGDLFNSSSTIHHLLWVTMTRSTQ